MNLHIVDRHACLYNEETNASLCFLAVIDLCCRKQKVKREAQATTSVIRDRCSRSLCLILFHAAYHDINLLAVVASLRGDRYPILSWNVVRVRFYATGQGLPSLFVRTSEGIILGVSRQTSVEMCFSSTSMQRRINTLS